MDAVPPRNYPREKGSPVSTYPVNNEGPSPFHPSVCLKTHWDPTAILRHTVPDTTLALPLDPRPWARINMVYVNSATNEPAPEVSATAVLPPGGQFYPPSRFSAAIDNESQLRRLDRQLGLAEKNQYIPPIDGDMYMSKKLLPPYRQTRDSRFISELEYPKALLRAGPYPCRDEQDKINIGKDSMLFYNATKQNRYKQVFKTKKMVEPGDLRKPSPSL